MKTIASFILAAILLTGCATHSQLVYKTLAAVGMSADKAMTAAADAYVAGKVKESDWQRIAEAHGKFLVAYDGAINLAKFDMSKLAPEDLLAIERELLNTVNAILSRK